MDASKKGRGRRGGLQEARDLIGLLGSLEQQGDTIDATAIAQRMGISTSEAQKLMALIETVGIDTYTPLSLYSNEDDTLSVAFDEGIHGTKLRLTKTETVAINAAFNYLQVPTDDPLRTKINLAMGNQGIDLETIRNSIAPAGTTPVEKNLRCIAKAIANDLQLEFEYKGNTDSTPKIRRVVPNFVQRSGENWLLEAYDVQRRANRTFRVDRITSCTTVKTPVLQDGEPQQKPSEKISNANHHKPNSVLARQEEDGRTQTRYSKVTLHILDTSVLQEFSWPGLNVVNRSEDEITATIPYYGEHSPWLPRMLAACGNRVHCEDERITSLATKYANEQLAHVRNT